MNVTVSVARPGRLWARLSILARWVVAICVVALPVVGCSAIREREQRDALVWGALDLTLEIDAIEEGADIAIWMPIPPETPTQRVVNPSFDPPSGFEFEPVRLDRNELLFVEGLAEDDEIKLSIRVEVEFVTEPVDAGMDEAFGWRIDPNRRKQKLGAPTQVRIRNANADLEGEDLVHAITWTQGPSIELRPPADGGPLSPPNHPAIEIDGVRLGADDPRVTFSAKWSEF